MSHWLNPAGYSPIDWLVVGIAALGLVLVAASWVRALIERDYPYMFRVYARWDTMIVVLLTAMMVAAVQVVYVKRSLPWTLGTIAIGAATVIAAVIFRERMRQVARNDQREWEIELDEEYSDPDGRDARDAEDVFAPDARPARTDDDEASR
jgi:cell division protein FtsW (lipid II flippase)